MRFSLPTHSSVRSALALGLVAVLAAGCSSSGDNSTDPVAASSGASAQGSTSASGDATTATPTPTPTPAPELPRGGRTIFPEYRLFGYSGAPDAPGQGRLGIGDLDERVVEMEKRAKPYAKGRKIMPVMELIATTVHSSPGKDGMYRTRIDDAIIQEWLDEARKRDAMLLLNIQPGRADFIDELKAYEKWLVNPDVGVALDPEWAVDAGQTPGRVFGHTSGAELNESAEYLAKIVADGNLPEKVMVFHQLNPGVVRNEKQLTAHEGVVMIKSVDGIGSPAAKTDTWKRVVKTMPSFVHPGFKLFYEEDAKTGGRVMTATEVLGLKPVPEYVLFE